MLEGPHRAVRESMGDVGFGTCQAGLDKSKSGSQNGLEVAGEETCCSLRQNKREIGSEWPSDLSLKEWEKGDDLFIYRFERPVSLHAAFKTLQ